MEIVNLLDFLNNTKSLRTLEYAKCSSKLLNILGFVAEEEQFINSIDFGVMCLYEKMDNQYVIVDGLNRFLSLSLLLHAVCECYKNTTQRNEKAIKTIRKKYLLDGSKTKLRLPAEEQVIYEKIIFGEKLSGKEKHNHIFVLLHNLWSQIKSENIQASKIFTILQKIRATIVDSSGVQPRDLYYSLNRNRDEINQLLLIENYLNSYGIKDEWQNIKLLYDDVESDIYLFFKDYFVNKFNFSKFDKNRLYEWFINYFETMLNYQKPKVIISNIYKSSKIYNNMLNVRFPDKRIRDAFIQIKFHNGEDT